jgi:hypothetical protein
LHRVYCFKNTTIGAGHTVYSSSLRQHYLHQVLWV